MHRLNLPSLWNYLLAIYGVTFFLYPCQNYYQIPFLSFWYLWDVMKHICLLYIYALLIILHMYVYINILHIFFSHFSRSLLFVLIDPSLSNHCVFIKCPMIRGYRFILVNKGPGWLVYSAGMHPPKISCQFFKNTPSNMGACRGRGASSRVCDWTD